MKKHIVITLFCLLFTLCAKLGHAASLSPFIEPVFWHASEQTAASWMNAVSTPQTGYTVFAPKNINFDWNTGVKLGFLYHPTSAPLDTAFYWTYFSTQKGLAVPLGAELIIPGFFSGFLSGNSFASANLEWKARMNTFDIEASHPFQINPRFSLRPLLGVKGAVINQTIDADWFSFLYTANEKVEHDFSGLGPKIGLSGDWQLTPETHFVGKFSTAFLWGRWNVNDTYSRAAGFFGLIPATTIVTRMNKTALGTLVFEYFAGIEWQPARASNVSARLGYEMQTWSDQLRLTTFQQLPTHGDLTVQGITCRIKFD